MIILGGGFIGFLFRVLVSIVIHTLGSNLIRLVFDTLAITLVWEIVGILVTVSPRPLIVSPVYILDLLRFYISSDGKNLAILKNPYLADP